MRAALVLSLAVLAAAPPPDDPVRVCMLSGSKEYRSEPSLTAFKERLETKHGMKVSLIAGRDGNKKGLPSVEGLAEADVLLVFMRRNTLPEDQLEAVRAFCAAPGKGVIGIRTASHAFQNWLAFDKEVLGGNYKGHYGDEEVEVAFDPGAADHPVLRGVAPWTRRGKLYKNPGVSTEGDRTVLQTGKAGKGRSEPVTWVRERREGRVFSTTLGIPGDFENPAFLRMLVNAVYWTANREPAGR